MWNTAIIVIIIITTSIFNQKTSQEQHQQQQQENKYHSVWLKFIQSSALLTNMGLKTFSFTTKAIFKFQRSSIFPYKL